MQEKQNDHESWFLEAPLVRQEAETDGELKNLIKSRSWYYCCLVDFIRFLSGDCWFWPISSGKNAITHKSKVGKLNIFLFNFFFSLKISLLRPRRPQKALTKTFRFFGFPTQKMLKYHWVLLKHGATFFSLIYTGGWNVWGEWFLARKQGNHQNFDPFLISKNLWLIFMEMKQKKIKMADSKKLSFLKLPILNMFLGNFHGLVLGLVELIDAKGIDVVQPIWGCTT
jgi:hypothetical protein